MRGNGQYELDKLKQICRQTSHLKTHFLYRCVTLCLILPQNYFMNLKGFDIKSALVANSLNAIISIALD